MWDTVGLSRFALREPSMPNNICQGIDYHKVNGPIDFSQVFLSSSMDWSVKMWVNGKSVRSSFVGLCAPYLNRRARATGPFIHSRTEANAFMT